MDVVALPPALEVKLAFHISSLYVTYYSISFHSIFKPFWVRNEITVVCDMGYIHSVLKTKPIH
jgi:hypothetical protein